jgi:signal transduction histidine kinase/pterin-4a-carbinolamine dehydratase
MRLLVSIFIVCAVTYADTVDSLKSVISTLNGKVKYEKSVELANILSGEGDSLALVYINEAISFAQESNEPKILMKARLIKGNIFFNIGEFKTAGEEYKNSLILAEKHNDTEYLYENCKKLGGVFYSLSDYKTSSVFYFKALDLAKLMEDDLKQADILNDLGSVFDAIKDYDESLKFSNQALLIYQKYNRMPDIAKMYNNIAITFNNRNEHKEALETFEKALKIYRDGNSRLYEAIILNNMASIYVAMKNYVKAIDYLNTSNEIFRENSDSYGMALNNHIYGRAYYELKNYDTAKVYLKRSIDYAEDNGVVTLIKDNYYYKAKTDSVTGNYKDAFESLKKYVEADSKLNEETRHRDIYEVMSKNELLQKEKQNSSLIRDNEIKRLEIDKQKQINNFFIIIFTLLSGIILFAYQMYKIKTRNEKIIKEYSFRIEELNKKLQEDIEKAKAELNESNEKLRKTEKEAARIDKLVSLGTMVAGITHEIKNPTQVIKLSMDSVRLSLNDLAVFIYDLIKLNKNTGKKNSEEIKKLIEKHKVTKLFADIKNLVISNKKSVELIDQIVTSTTKISYFNRETTDNLLNDIISDVLVIMKNSIKYSASIEVELDPNLPRYKCNYQEISQVVINLLTNARDAITESDKHSGDGLIRIKTGVENDRIFIEVTDNGIGIKQDETDKIFEAFYTTKTTGKGQGLGLSIVKSIADIYGGFIAVKSEPGEATSFKIFFPLNKTEKEVQNA